MPEKQNSNPEEKTSEQQQNTEEQDIDWKAKFEELEKKQANLNQGIAQYRDAAQESKQRAEELEAKIAELEARFETQSKEKIEIDEADEEILEHWAKEKGFITKDELEGLKTELNTTTQQQIHNQAVSEFLEKYPQYDNNENWEKVKQEFALYRTPTTLQGYRQILDKIHQTLSIPEVEKRGGDKVRAEITTKGRLSLGGGSQRAASPEREETIESLQKKYPNLSKEQIEARLAEIDTLYKDRQ